jgi:hypothetical protein
VKSARLSVVFEAQLEGVVLPSGLSEKEALRSQQCMIENDSLVAWNWQKLEVDNSNSFVAVHPEFFVTESGSQHYFRNRSEKLAEVMNLVLMRLPDKRKSVQADLLLAKWARQHVDRHQPFMN